MRHNDVRICATRNKASGWVRVRYMLVCACMQGALLYWVSLSSSIK
jgi:hypothetical protein